jgi:hypothetical protein
MTIPINAPRLRPAILSLSFEFELDGLAFAFADPVSVGLVESVGRDVWCGILDVG